jgi:hypothetical protein
MVLEPIRIAVPQVTLRQDSDAGFPGPTGILPPTPNPASGHEPLDRYDPVQEDQGMGARSQLAWRYIDIQNAGRRGTELASQRPRELRSVDAHQPRVEPHLESGVGRPE